MEVSYGPAIALKLGGYTEKVGPDGRETYEQREGLLLGCSHGCASTSLPPRSHQASAPRGRAVHKPSRRAARSTEDSATYKSYKKDSRGAKIDPEGTRFNDKDFGNWFGPMDRKNCAKLMKGLYDAKLGPGQTSAAVRSPASPPPPTPAAARILTLPLVAGCPRAKHAALEEVRRRRSREQ